jgi:hypothetical protein
MNIWISLRYSSTLPLRGGLAVSAALWAVLFLFAPARLDVDPVYAFLFALAPPFVWAGIYAIDALALLWRIVETRPRVGWTRVINAATCGLWAMYLACALHARGFIAPDFADDVAMLVGAIWCTLRSDMNVSDRESA